MRIPIFHFLYNGKYVEASYLVPFFALETTIWSASLGPAILLRAMEAPRALFVANLAASIVAIVFGIPATKYFGLVGVVWSMIIANSLYVVVAFILHGRKAATLKVPTAPVADPLLAD
jgi:O-antigen/teichoic acid export membrane protein